MDSILSSICHSFIILFFYTATVKYQAKPLIIYTSSKSEESFISALQRSGTLLFFLIIISY